MERKITTIKQRVLQLLKDKGITVSNFFPSIGESYANFTGKRLESSLSSDTLGIIISKFPDVNTDWLITGEGEMYKKTAPVLDINIQILEKFYALFEHRENEHKIILEQNSEIIRQNSDIIKQNSEVMRQNGELIRVLKRLTSK